MRVLRLGQLALVLAAVGCSTSVAVKDFKPAQGPEGVHMQLTLKGPVTSGKKVAGELLAVNDDGVLLNVAKYGGSSRAGKTVVMVPYSMMDSAKLDQMGGAKVESQDPAVKEAYLARLRLVARFPQGLTDDLLTHLLTELGQEQLEVPQKIEKQD